MLETLGGRCHTSMFLEHGIVDFRPYETIQFKDEGIRSPGVYMDNRRWPSNPDAWNEILHPIAVFAEGLRVRGELDTIAGVESASIMHGAVIAHMLDLPFVYVRKKPKGHGTKKSIEGDIDRVVRNKRVLVIEDVGATGGSSLRAVETLRQHGAAADQVAFLAVYDFPEMHVKFAEARVAIHTVTTFPAILELCNSSGTLPKGRLDMPHWHKELIKHWLKDPRKPWKWNTNMAGFTLGN